MSFKWETNKTSPNSTDNSQVYATWGRPRTIEAIAIHWWGDPNQNPQFDGIVDYLCRPGGGSSAHLVATGTDRRVSCIVDFEDAAWATNSANPYTIAIECDPRCRDEDYDVIGELIAQIRQVYGNLPLVPHRQFVSTACPGNYDLDRLSAVADTKLARPEDDWGVVSNKVQAPPADTRPEYVKNFNKWGSSKVFYAIDDTTPLRDLTNTPKIIKNYAKGTPFEILGQTKLGENVYYMTKYSVENGKWQGFDTYEFQETDPNYVSPKPVEPTPTPTPTPETHPVPTESPSKVGLDESSTTLLQDVKRLLEELKTLLKSIFKIGG